MWDLTVVQYIFGGHIICLLVTTFLAHADQYVERNM